MNKSSLERNGWNWAAVPADVILNENLTHADVRVYAYLLWRSGKKEHSWPNVQTIADDLHIGYSTARLALSHLVKQGWINRKRQMMRSSVTFINEIPFPRSANGLAHVQLTGEPTNSYPVSRVNKSHINDSKRKEAQKPAPPDSLFPIVEAISRVCRMDIKANKGKLFREAKELVSATPTPTPELIEQHYNGSSAAFWRAHDWRGQKGEPPTPAAIRQTWGQWANYSSAPPVKMFDHAAHPAIEVSAADRAAALAVLNKRLGK